jgi:hypothetical protein
MRRIEAVDVIRWENGAREERGEEEGGRECKVYLLHLAMSWIKQLRG